MEKKSEKHRTTIGYFLNHGKWDEGILEQCIKTEVIRRIYGEAERTGKTIRGSKTESREAYHVVSAFVAENQLVLGELVTLSFRKNQMA